MQRSDFNLLAEAYSSINNQQINEGISDSLVIRAGEFLLKKLQQVDPSAFKKLKQIISSKDEQTLSNIINKPLVQKAVNSFSQPIQESIIGDAGKIIKKIYNYCNTTPRGAGTASLIMGALCVLSAIYIGTHTANSPEFPNAVEAAKGLTMYLNTVGIASMVSGAAFLKSSYGD